MASDYRKAQIHDKRSINLAVNLTVGASLEIKKGKQTKKEEETQLFAQQHFKHGLAGSKLDY